MEGCSCVGNQHMAVSRSVGTQALFEQQGVFLSCLHLFYSQHTWKGTELIALEDCLSLAGHFDSADTPLRRFHGLPESTQFAILWDG